MNKKGSVVGIVIILLFIIGFGTLFGSIMHAELGQTCKFRSNSVLQSVNSIEDIDTGLMSSGTIREKTLLFKGGLVATFRSSQLRDVELVLGKKYRIDKCSNNGGRIWYELSDALVSEGEQDGK